jgi:hypothetical protein
MAAHCLSHHLNIPTLVQYIHLSQPRDRVGTRTQVDCPVADLDGSAGDSEFHDAGYTGEIVAALSYVWMQLVARL